MQLGNFKNTEFKTYYGVAPCKIVVNAQGVPVINPTKEELSKYLDNVPADGEDYKYVDKIVLTKGFDSLGGKQIISKEEFEETGGMNDNVVVEKEVDKVTLRFLMETVIKESTIVKGVKTTTEVKHLFPLVFNFFNNIRTDKDGIKRQVFNGLGQTAWLDSDNRTKKGEEVTNAQLKYFTVTTADEIQDAYNSYSSLGFEQFINFIYSYAKATPGSADILKEIKLEDFFKGDFKSLKQVANMIHKLRTVTTPTGTVQLFGVNVPFIGKVVKSDVYQDFYPQFSFAVGKEDGSYDKKFSAIKNAITESRKPVGDVVYSPETKGLIISKEFGGMIEWGLTQIPQSVIDEFIRRTGTEVSNPFANKDVVKEGLENLEDLDF